jgi:indolepyruvate ferredoxin oxidoreductase, beta subunit
MSGDILKLAIMAVGGQGGGVLTNWIEAMARTQGYAVQATSVAGVAQRTGATIYYLEMAPMAPNMPVFSLAPAAGDVDILIAAELMEAGRAVMRGFVTPDRTTLIASSHRALAVSEKSAPGDGIADGDEVSAAAEIAAQNLILLDMEAIALAAGSVVSASLFGALAASDRLPFPVEAFEAAIVASGKSTTASLKAFRAGFDATLGKHAPKPKAKKSGPSVQGATKRMQEWNALLERAMALPENVQDLALAGLRKVVDFQGTGYGGTYLDRVNSVLTQDTPAKDYILTREAAKHIANAMAYDDIIRVADLKTRTSRFQRVHEEMRTPEDALLHVTEFMHPGASEIVGLLPAGIGAWFEARPNWMARVAKVFGKSRRLRSDTLPGFLQLYFLGGLRRMRLRSLRHKVEVAHLEQWLEAALGYLPLSYDLAVETLRTRRLIKGYSDTHSHGVSRFDRVQEGIKLVANRKDAADWAHRLIAAALKDEKDEALDGALETIRSFA